MSEELVHLEVSGGVATVTLDSPSNRNALSRGLVSDLQQHLDAALADNRARLIVLTGAGPVFCSGADLAYIQRISKFDFNQNQQDSSNLMKLFLQIYTHRKPVIALVQGPALAGGCGLATV